MGIDSQLKLKKIMNKIYSLLKKLIFIQKVYSFSLKIISNLFIPIQKITEYLSKIKIFRILIFYCLPKNQEILISTNLGKFIINTNDNIIGKKMFIHNEPYESRKVHRVLTYLNENSLKISHLIEIGANNGSVTISFLKKDKNLTATCIEGDTYSKKYLDYNLRLNNLNKRCTSIEALIGEKSRKAKLVRFKGDSGNSLVLENNDAELDKYIKKLNLKVNKIKDVRIQKFSEIALIPSINRDTLIWLDVEGSELSVLKGVDGLDVNPLIVFELNPAGIYSLQKYPEEYLQEFENLFINCGYSEAIMLSEDKKIYKVENGFIFRLSQEISNSNAHEDILIY